MKVDVYECEKPKKMKTDVLITADNAEEAMDTSISHIPFRMFINEFMGICPGYSRINNQLSVNVHFPCSECYV